MKYHKLKNSLGMPVAESPPLIVGTYEVDPTILDSFLEVLFPQAWVREEVKGLSTVYVNPICGLSSFELEEMDDKIYNSFIRS